MREERRQQLVVAFEEVLGELGYEGATVARLAEVAHLSPGLVHHYFRDKDELTEELLTHLVRKLVRRLARARDLPTLLDTALSLGPNSDTRAARAWVGVFAESMRRPDLRRLLQVTLGRFQRALQRTGADDEQALLLIALTTGFLVLGAIDPRFTGGRAAELARRVRLEPKGSGHTDATSE
ncbi:MAG: TetR family transcriptional regulator [Deltaproteobacteria bacterium]|nr:TetR family transcriptional regulator [Deltaproteobacteria bacterium]